MNLGEVGKTCYIAMELVEGVAVRDLLAAGRGSVGEGD